MPGRRWQYSETSRGPLRAIVAVRPECGEYTITLDCAHEVARRCVRVGQTTTNCEVCKAIAHGTRAA